MKASIYFEARGRSDYSRGIPWIRGIRALRGLPQWARDAYIHGNVTQRPWRSLLGCDSNG